MPLLTPDEAARELAVSQKQLKALTGAGKIRYINIGLGRKRETRRYDPADIERFKEARRCQSTSDRPGKPIRTTSGSTVYDFQAILAAEAAAKQSGSKPPAGTTPGRRPPRQPSP